MAQVELPIPGITVRDVLRVMIKHRWPILGLYCAIIVFCALYCFFWPPTYEAAVQLLVTHTREEPVISSDQNSVRMLNKVSVTVDDLNSEMAIIQSPAVLEKTVRDMQIDTAPEPWYWRLLNKPFVFARSVYDGYHSKPSPTPLVKGVQRLAGKLIVMPEQKSAIIEVRLRWGDPRTTALFAALCVFFAAPEGFTNRALRPLVGRLFDSGIAGYSAGRMTYDLRRLRLKGLIHRIPNTHRYTATSYGLKVAFFNAKLYLRIFRPNWPVPFDNSLTERNMP